MRVRASGAVLVAVLAAGLAACSSGTVAPIPVNGSSPTMVTPTPDGPHVGEAITIAGNSDGSEVRVTVVAVQSTVSKDSVVKTGKKKKLVAVQFEIVNTGTATYHDAPSNGAIVFDSEGDQVEASIMYSKIGAGALLPIAVKLAPGKQALGYVVFEVPKSFTVARVQFTMDSGFGEAATWDVP